MLRNARGKIERMLRIMRRKIGFSDSHKSYLDLCVFVQRKEVAEIHHFTYEKNFNPNVDAPHYQALHNISKIKTRQR